METFSQATTENKSELITATAVCFGEPIAAVEFFFENRVNLNNCYICKIGNEIASILHTFFMELKLCGKTFNAYYIYGACTLPKYRRHGYMSRLLKFTESKLKDKNADFVFLVPEEKSLESFYAKIGYINFFKTKTITMQNSEFKSYCAKKISKNSDYSFLYMEKIREKLYNNINSIIYRSDDIKYAVNLYDIFNGKTVTTDGGYAICEPESKNTLLIRDFVCNEKHVPELFAKIYNLFPNKETYIIKVPPTYNFFKNRGESNFYGMIKPLKSENEKIMEKVISCGDFPYIGLAYD